MAAAAAISVSNTATYNGPDAASAAPAQTGLSFREVLSDLNPLQYLPVVGTLYRAITGDTIPRPLREAGSLVVSGLMGGPIGVATNLAMLGFEKLTGIDLEEMEQNMLASLKSPRPAGLSGTLLQNAAVEGAGAPAAAANQAVAAAWTPAQRAAYGVAKEADGVLQQDTLSEADVLNALQLRAIAS